MKAMKFMWLLAAMVVVQTALAQEEKPKLALNIGLGNQYRFTAASSPLEKHYSIGGQVDLVFNDKWMISYAQSSSLAPTDLLKTLATDRRKMHLNEYTLGAGYKASVGSSVYLIGRANFGIAALKFRKSYDSDWDEIRDEFSSAARSSFLVAPELAVGVRLNRFLSLQTGASYRINLAELEKGGMPSLRTSDMNGLAVNLTLVGTIPLKKR